MATTTSTTITPYPTRSVWVVLTLAVIVIFLVIAAYAVRTTANQPTYDLKREKERYANLAKLRQDEHETLTTVAWITPDKNIVRLPLDEAMAQVLPLLQAKPVVMGTVIPGSTPQTVPAAATAQAPQPGAQPPAIQNPAGPAANAPAPARPAAPPVGQAPNPTGAGTATTGAPGTTH